MKSTFKLVLMTLACAHTAAQADEHAKVYSGNDNMHWARYDSFKLTEVMYQVDAQAQLCMVLVPGSSPSVVPCEALAKRPEWAAIINWVD